MRKFIKELNYIIYLLLLFYLTIDSLTGISISAGGPSFSIPYKLFTLALMVLVVLNYNYTGKYTLFIVFLFSLLFVSQIFLFLNRITDTGVYSQKYVKLIANIIFYIYFMECKNKDKQFSYYIKNIVVINGVVFLLNLIAGILGFGHASYVLGEEAGSGTVGFFYAPNETYLILLSFSVIYLLMKNRNPISYIFILYMAFTISTKSAILSAVVVVLYDYYRNSPKKRKILIWLLIPVIVFLIYMIFINFLATIRTFEFVLSRLDNANGNSKLILNAIMSGRVVYLEAALQKWKMMLNLPLFLVGTSSAITTTIEIDFFDTLFINGAIFTFILICFYGYLIITSKKKNSLVFVMNLLFIFISFLAGHTWPNLSGGLFFIIANVLILTDIKLFSDEKLKKIKHLATICIKYR